MATYLPRSAWTSTSAAGSAFVASNVDQINVHYPASGNVKLAGLSRDQVARRLQGWRSFHVTGRGWSDIGYNFAVDGSGRVWELRGWRVGAHAASPSNPGQNRRAVGVLFVLGNTESPTAAQLEAFRHFRTTRVLARYPKATRVVGHGQVPGASTSCPGAPLRAAISRGDLTRKPGGTTPPPKPTPPPVEDDMPYRQWPQADKDALVRDVTEGVVNRNLLSGVDGKYYPLQNFIRSTHKQTDWAGLRGGIESIVRRIAPTAVLGYVNPNFPGGDVYRRIRETQRDAAVSRALTEQMVAKGAALSAQEVEATTARVEALFAEQDTDDVDSADQTQG